MWAAVLFGCRDRLDEIDEIYYRWDDRQLFCAAGIDDVSGNSPSSIEAALDRAAAAAEVVQLFTHAPGRTIRWEVLEGVLRSARERKLRFVTYPELSAGGSGGGLALSFDDADITTWSAARPLLQQYGGRATFFVTRYHRWSGEGKEQLRALASDGHAIEAHARDHLPAPPFVDRFGLARYVEDEALPSINALRAEGYPVTTYAYPFGARTKEIDRALLQYVDRLRTVTFSIDGPLVADPCPE